VGRSGPLSILLAVAFIAAASFGVGAGPAAAQPVPVNPSTPVPPGAPTVESALAALEHLISDATGAAAATPGQDPGARETEPIHIDDQTSFQAHVAFEGGRILGTIDIDFSDSAHTVHATAVIDGPLCTKAGGVADPEVRLKLEDNGATLTETTLTAELTIRANAHAKLDGAPTATVTANAGAAARQLIKALTQKVGKEAQRVWQSGYCVQIAVDGPNPRHVDPGEHVDLTGKVTARMRGPVPGDVTAKLSGKTRVEPASQPAPDLELSYEAPSKRGDSASLTLHSESNRGVGETVVELTTSTIFIVSGTLQVSTGPLTGYLVLSETRLAPVKGGHGAARGEVKVDFHLETSVPCPTAMDTKETLTLEARPTGPAKKGEPQQYRLTAVGGTPLGGTRTVLSGGCEPKQGFIDPGENPAYANSVIARATPILFTEEGGRFPVSAPSISGGALVITPEK